ncbi:MAG: hypothetical protein AB7N65_16870 [Vicinamibacterales bacterium]
MAAKIVKNAAGIPVQRSEYGGYEIVPPPEREPLKIDPSADHMAERELMERFGWTAEQLETAKQLGLPQGRSVQTIKRFAWGYTETRIYSRERVEAWADRVRSLAL